MIPLNDTRGFIDLEINWGVWILLTAVGAVVWTIMLAAWGKMDFNVPLVSKIIVYVGCAIAGFIFTKLWFE